MKIAKVLGTEGLNEYLAKYNLTLDSAYDGLISNWPRKKWSKFVTQHNAHLCPDEALDLLDKVG